MSFAAFDTRSSGMGDHAFAKAPGPSQVDASAGCCLWLQWMQKILSADSLVLYRRDLQLVNGAFTLQASLPVGIPADKVSLTLAKRCADAATIVTLNDTNKATGITVAIPDGVGKQCENSPYILIVRQRLESGPDLQTLTKLVIWGFSTLDRFTATGLPSDAQKGLSQWMLDQIANEQSGACMYALLCGELSLRTGSDCCLLSELKTHSNQVKAVSLLALSGQPRVDARLAASRSLVANVEQTYIGESLPVLPRNQTSVDRTLVVQTPVEEAIEPCARMSLPVCVAHRWFVISLERSTYRPYSDKQGEHLLEDIGSALRLIELTKASNQGVRAACARLIRQRVKAIGTSRLRMLGVAIFCLVALFLFFIPTEHRVSAPLNVEALERHVLIAPEDGIVESIEVKAGDQVVKGQTLATLDDQDLQLQQQKLRSQSLQNQQSYAKALAAYDRVEVTRLKEQASLINAELTQIALQREKMKLVAPTDSVVLSASLDDYLGASISAGETLFSLGSVDSHRLVLNVSEYDVRYVELGQDVGLRLSANPSRVLDAKVVAIMPLVDASAGENTVKVHAQLLDNVSLRPGMQGLGKILVGRQALAIQWLKRVGTRLFWLLWKLGLIR